MPISPFLATLQFIFCLRCRNIRYGELSTCVPFDPAEDETDPKIECLGDSYPFGFTLVLNANSVSRQSARLIGQSAMEQQSA